MVCFSSGAALGQVSTACERAEFTRPRSAESKEERERKRGREKAREREREAKGSRDSAIIRGRAGVTCTRGLIMRCKVKLFRAEPLSPIRARVAGPAEPARQAAPRESRALWLPVSWHSNLTSDRSTLLLRFFLLSITAGRGRRSRVRREADGRWQRANATRKKVFRCSLALIDFPPMPRTDFTRHADPPLRR